MTENNSDDQIMIITSNKADFAAEVSIALDSGYTIVKIRCFRRWFSSYLEAVLAKRPASVGLEVLSVSNRF